jgi:predicted phosphoribosyltransferase
MGGIVVNERLTNRYHVFKDREEAAVELAKMIRVEELVNPVVLAIPSGGVPVGATLASILKCEFSLIICRKLHFPNNPEAGFGAVNPDGDVIFNEELINYLRIDRETIDMVVKLEIEEIKKRLKTFGSVEALISNRSTIITDDGLASGYTMLSAIKYVKKRKPERIIIAVPTASISALNLIAPHADIIYCANVRSDVYGFAVADAYKEWHDVDNVEVLSYINKFRNKVS